MVRHLHPDDLRALGARLLRLAPEAPVRVRILRDVLVVPAGDPRLRAARDDLPSSPHVGVLLREQGRDGGWGRLHSRDTSARQVVPTTEWGVNRALALGLDLRSEPLQRAAEYLAAIIAGRLIPSDRPERNDRWETGVRLFAAATLSWIDPEHPDLDEPWNLWHEIAQRTFARGTYDPDAEASAHEELTGASVRDSYLVLANRYVLALLGARGGDIERDVQHALFAWLSTRPSGVGYHDTRIDAPDAGASAALVEQWVRTQEILARLPVWSERATSAAEWLMKQRRTDGLWDLGARVASSPYVPLSSDWRKKDTRAVDWTTRALCLIASMQRPRSTHSP